MRREAKIKERSEEDTLRTLKERRINKSIKETIRSNSEQTPFIASYLDDDSILWKLSLDVEVLPDLPSEPVNRRLHLREDSLAVHIVHFARKLRVRISANNSIRLLKKQYLN
jgi:hypothetical protein